MPEASLFTLGEVRREREVSSDVEVALGRNAPQALLRDLHRPVTEFKVSAFDFATEPKIGGDAISAATAENRRTFLASYRVPIVDLVHTNADMAVAYRSVRALIAMPWADAPKLGRLRDRG